MSSTHTEASALCDECSLPRSCSPRSSWLRLRSVGPGPLTVRVLRPFSVGPDPYAGGQHRGVDIGVPVGSEVRAPAGGSVSFVGSLPQGGRALTIQTADGYSVTLLQLAEIVVARGAAVAEGDVVGRSGSSADPATVEPHVHLGVRLTADPDGYVDPLGLLPTPAPAPVAVPAPAPEPVRASGEAAPAAPEPPPALAPEPEATKAVAPVGGDGRGARPGSRGPVGRAGWGGVAAAGARDARRGPRRGRAGCGTSAATPAATRSCPTTTGARAVAAPRPSGRSRPARAGRAGAGEAAASRVGPLGRSDGRGRATSRTDEASRTGRARPTRHLGDHALPRHDGGRAGRPGCSGRTHGSASGCVGRARARARLRPRPGPACPPSRAVGRPQACAYHQQ